jgi:hypothetical protein
MIEQLRVQHADLVKRFQRDKRRSAVMWACAAVLLAALVIGGIAVDRTHGDQIRDLRGRTKTLEDQAKKDAATLVAIKVTLQELTDGIKRGDSDRTILARLDTLEGLVTRLGSAQAVPTVLRGPAGPTGKTGPKGPPATQAQVNASVAFYCATHNDCTGPSGTDGIDGQDGTDGTDGRDGTNGKNGVSVVGVSCNRPGLSDKTTFTFRLSDGSTIHATC